MVVRSAHSKQPSAHQNRQLTELRKKLNIDDSEFTKTVYEILNDGKPIVRSLSAIDAHRLIKTLEIRLKQQQKSKKFE